MQKRDKIYLVIIAVLLLVFIVSLYYYGSMKLTYRLNNYRDQIQTSESKSRDSALLGFYVNEKGFFVDPAKSLIGKEVGSMKVYVQNNFPEEKTFEISIMPNVTNNDPVDIIKHGTLSFSLKPGRVKETSLFLQAKGGESRRTAYKITITADGEKIGEAYSYVNVFILPDTGLIANIKETF